MAGKRIVSASILLVLSAVLLLFLGPGTGVEATNWREVHTEILSDNTPGANADVTSTFNFNPFPSANTANMSALVLSSAGPAEGQIALDSEIPDGSCVGSSASATTMSLFSGPCSTPLFVDMPFMDCTTDTLNTAPWVLTGDNLVLDCNGNRNEDGSVDPEGDGNCIDTIDNDGNGDPDCADPQCQDEPSDTNGIPTYCDHYPAFLNQMFNNARPRARYVGHSVIIADAPATISQFVIFNPEALGPPWGDTYGFTNVWVVDNPIQPTSPSTISDSCDPLITIATLNGLTNGEYAVVDGPEPYELSAGCNDGFDQDSDTVPDDGCLYIPDPCDGVDNDGDTDIDEGCDYVRYQNPPSHTGLFGTGTHAVRTYTQSQRDVDDDDISNNLDTCPLAADTGVDADGDGLDAACDPDDSTPSSGAPAGCTVTSGIPDEDQDCFPNRQDNCPLTPNGDPYDPVPSGFTQSDTDNPPGQVDPADGGPPLDGIGDRCDASPNTADGHYHTAMSIAYTCVPDNYGADDTDGDGDPDNDGDGVCDSTEDLLGSNKNNAASTPEHIAIDLAIGAGAATAPGTCSDYTTYNHPDAGPVDNDGDTLTNAADPGCALPIAGDSDADGVPDSVDNCPAQQNQEQVDSDGDLLGDECDDDDDNDGYIDGVEDYLGTDPKDMCADHPMDNAWPVDFDNNQHVNIIDVLKFKPVILTPVGPGTARYDLNRDGTINIIDVLKFKPVILTHCRDTLTFTNTTFQDVNDIHIEFFAEITVILNAVDDAGVAWDCEKVPPLCANATDDDGDTLVNDGCRALFGGGEFPPMIPNCLNNVDDDGDTKVNDGCPKVATDDDGDTVTNDGCPAVEVPETLCGDNTDNDGDTTVDDGCANVGPGESGTQCIDSEDRNTGGVTYTYGSPSYKVNCKRKAGYMPHGSTLTIDLKGKRPPVVRCYDWTADCEVVNSSSKPCNFHNDTGQDVWDLYVEFGLDLDGDTVSDAPGLSWCDNVQTPYEKIVSLAFPAGIPSAHIPFTTPLPDSSVVRAQWWRPGPWTIASWYWTNEFGDPVPPLAHYPIDKAVLDIVFDDASAYPNPGPDIGNTLEVAFLPMEQTKVSVTSVEVNNSDIVPYDAQVNFYANIPPGCYGRWVWAQEPPYPPDAFWPFDIHTRFGDPFAPPMSPEEKGEPVDPLAPKEPGVDPTIFEVDLHFQTRDYSEAALYDYIEVPGKEVEITRFFDFHCDVPGDYDFEFCNKIEAKAVIDNDGDTQTDEDPYGDINIDGNPDDDFDGFVDEDPPEPAPDPDWANNVLCEVLHVIQIFP